MKILKYIFLWLSSPFLKKKEQYKKAVGHDPKQEPVYLKPEPIKKEEPIHEIEKKLIIGSIALDIQTKEQRRIDRLIATQGCKIFSIGGAKILARDQKNAERKYENLLNEQVG